MEKVEEESKKRQDFEELFERTLSSGEGESVPLVEYNLQYPKEEFLRFLVETKSILLHGSSNKSLEVLEPQQANDSSKQFGNKKAIYGVADPVLPMFFAIQNREKIDGVIVSGKDVDSESGEVKYIFKMSKKMVETKPWKRGMIYLVDKSDFVQGTDDRGEVIDEWVSEKPVKPIAKLEIGPEDFRFMGKIEEHDE